jgi:hypothetical protein
MTCHSERSVAKNLLLVATMPRCEIVLAKSVAGKPYDTLRFVPHEGRNLARKLPYGDVCSAIGFCLKRTTNIALQAVGQTQSSRNERMLKYTTMSVVVFGHVWHEIGH